MADLAARVLAALAAGTRGDLDDIRLLLDDLDEETARKVATLLGYAGGFLIAAYADQVGTTRDVMLDELRELIAKALPGSETL